MNDNVLVRILAALVTAAALVVSFIIGTVVAVIALGAVVLAWIAFAVRTWQVRRRWRKQGGATRGDGSTVIEGEYRIEEQRRDG